MDNSLKELKKRIMRRIYVIFLVRNAAPLAFDCFFVIAIAFIATLFISIKDVLANLSVASAGGSLSRFTISAFEDTELSVKILLLGLGIVGFLALRHLKRAMRAVRALGKTDSSKNL